MTPLADSGAGITWPTVVRLVLVLALTAFAAAVMCPAGHHGPAAGSGRSAVMEHPVQADGTMTTAVAGSAATPPRACCQAEDNAPSAVISFGRAVPPEDAVALDAEAALFPSAASHPPPGLPAPVPDRPEHLTPSLAALSISRT